MIQLTTGLALIADSWKNDATFNLSKAINIIDIAS